MACVDKIALLHDEIRKYGGKRQGRRCNDISQLKVKTFMFTKIKTKTIAICIVICQDTKRGLDLHFLACPEKSIEEVD